MNDLTDRMLVAAQFIDGTATHLEQTTASPRVQLYAGMALRTAADLIVMARRQMQTDTVTVDDIAAMNRIMEAKHAPPDSPSPSS